GATSLLMKLTSASWTLFLTVPVKKLWSRLTRKPQNPEPSRLTLPTATAGSPASPARSLPLAWSCRLNCTVAVTEAALTVMVEPPIQHVVPHALTVRCTLGSVTCARSPPGTRASVLDGGSQRIESAL